MSKGCWITILEKDEDKGRKLFESVSRLGVAADGHFWIDDLEHMTWNTALPNLSEAQCGVWVIAGSPESFRSPGIRYGLSLLALCVLGQRGTGFPILIVPDAEGVTEADLPTLLKGAKIVPPGTSPGAKIIAAANMPLRRIPAPYRLNLFAIAGLGQWFEVGPAAGENWKGAMLGVDAGEIVAHGVGEDGKLPDKAVLNYPMKGMKLAIGEQEFTAWAVSNPLDGNQSYFVKIEGQPKTLLFGELPDADEAALFRVDLQ